jgi:hypothetical protein
MFNTYLPAPKQHDWLLAEPAPSDLHPWDIAHQVAQDKMPGSARFAPPDGVYAEPDILHTRQRPEKPRFLMAKAAKLP